MDIFNLITSTIQSSPVAIMFIILVLYFTPTALAQFRGHSYTASIFVINLFLGWTGFMWVIALAMAAMPQKP